MMLLQKTLEARHPGGGTHWTCRAMADTTGLSKSTVQRLWTAFNLQPNRQKHFQLATDPFFARRSATSSASISTRPTMRCAVCRREEPDPGPGAYPTHPDPRARLR